MKLAFFFRLFALSICMMFSASSFSQSSDPSPEPFSSSSPFESVEQKENKKRGDDEIIYDSVKLNVPSFSDFLSAPQRPFSSSFINNRSGAEPAGDPGMDSDAPIDDHIVILFVAVICFRFRLTIKENILKYSTLYMFGRHKKII
ncbi:MAG: hypothetical protein NVS3B19_09880 [Ginsengibacter sp.]